MQRTSGTAILAVILSLSYASAVASDQVQHNRLCQELMSRVLQQDELTFAQSSDDLGTDVLGLLDEIVEIATDCPALSIAVTGHTDDTGNEPTNYSLSKARAEAVVAYLMEHGIEAGRLTAIGAGSATPIASNDDHAGRQVNRRIEFDIDFGVEPLRKKRLTTFP